MTAADRISIHILLVEDNPGDVLLTQEALKDAKIVNDLTVASNGEEALEILYKGIADQHPLPDLIMLDLNMPRKGGHDVLKALNTDPDLFAIPVVILTSSMAEYNAFQENGLEVSQYIQKPVNFEKMVSIVHSVSHFSFDIVRITPQT